MTTVTARFLTKIREKPRRECPSFFRTTPNREYELLEVYENHAGTWAFITRHGLPIGWVPVEVNGVKSFREPVLK
jgi:hypothetical protein